jgi:hypothetical protein
MSMHTIASATAEEGRRARSLRMGDGRWDRNGAITGVQIAMACVSSLPRRLPLDRPRGQPEPCRASRTPSTNLRSTSRIISSLPGPRVIGSSLTIMARTAPSA